MVQQLHPQQQQNLQQQQVLNNKQVVGQVAPNNHMPQGPLGQSFPEWRRVPIQLTIPAAPGNGDGHRILSIDVPEIFLQGHHLKSILTGQVISTTMGLPLTAACAFLQDHVNVAFLNHQQSFFEMNNRQVLQTEAPSQGKVQKLQEIPQKDGSADSSDEDDDKSDDVSEDEEHEKENDEIEEDGAAGAEEEPLNSGDDVSDADGTEESFETENVIVCQYDKVRICLFIIYKITVNDHFRFVSFNQ